MDWPLSELRGLSSLPFNGPLGDGRDGDVVISSNTTATQLIHQVNSLNVSAVWTALSRTMGGFLIACRGRVTVTATGIIDASARGCDENYLGWGYGFAGTGSGDGTSIRSGITDLSLGIHNSFTPGSAVDSSAAQLQAILSATGRFVRLGTTTNGNAFPSFMTAAFEPLWNLSPFRVLGWGAGIQTGVSSKRGGGCLLIVTNELDLQASSFLKANGEADGANATGGGSVLVFYRTLIANAGTVQANGGTGSSRNGGAGFTNVTRGWWY